MSEGKANLRIWLRSITIGFKLRICSQFSDCWKLPRAKNQGIIILAIHSVDNARQNAVVLWERFPELGAGATRDL